MSSNEQHMIRLLDAAEEELIRDNHQLTVNLFFEELFHLGSILPGAILTNESEINTDNKLFAYAMRLYVSLSDQIEGKEQFIDVKDPNIIARLISDIISEVEYLWKTWNIRNVLNLLGPEDICYMKDKKTFFLSNWAKLAQLQCIL